MQFVGRFDGSLRLNAVVLEDLDWIWGYDCSHNLDLFIRSNQRTEMWSPTAEEERKMARMSVQCGQN